MKKLFYFKALLCLTASLYLQSLYAQSFIENVGQITDTQLQYRKDINFKVQQQGDLQVFIANGSLHYQWMRAEQQSDSATLYHGYRMDMHLLGSNPNVTIVLGKPLPAFERYFLSWVNTDNDNAGKVAHQYQSILYKDIYPNIDWHLYFTEEGALEYDFIIRPSGKVSDIRWKYYGAQNIALQANGDIAIQTPNGCIIEKAPISFEQSSRHSVPSNFLVKNDTIMIATSHYNGTLVIDPVIEWGTYFGGSLEDYGLDITVDSLGNIYTVGSTNSTSNIATNGAHQQTFGGGAYHFGADAYVAKWSNDGQLIWASYYGGTAIDIINNVKVLNNNVYLCGFTQSTDGIATNGSFQSDKSGNSVTYDVMLIKMDSGGLRNWATYFGGSLNDGNTALSMDIDANENLYLAGVTQSINFYTSNNAYSNTRQLTDGFISKFDSNGNPLWSTYYGGNGTDDITKIKVDDDGSIYITGNTNSTANLATANAYQTTHAGSEDIFISKIDTLGFPIWCTYVGGMYQDKASSLSLLPNHVIVGGKTQSSNMSYGNSFQNTGMGLLEGIVISIAKDGQMNFVSYLGGSNNDEIVDIGLVNDDIHIMLQTNSTDNISTANSLFPTFSGQLDLALIIFDSLFSKKYGTYIGGSASESNGKITQHVNGVLVLGTSSSSSNIATLNGYQAFLGGSNDAFMIKILDCEYPILQSSTIIGSDSICPNQEVMFSINAQDSVHYHWDIPNYWQGTSDSNSIVITPDVQAGMISVWLSNTCGLKSDTLVQPVGVFPIQNIEIQKEGNALVCTQSFSKYQWLFNRDTIVGATQNNYIPIQNGWHMLQVIDANGCVQQSDSIMISHLSIEAINEDIVKMYPNPTHDFVTIITAKPMQLSVVNTLGQTVADYNITAGEQTITMNTWPSGMYLFILSANGYKKAFNIQKI